MGVDLRLLPMDCWIAKDGWGYSHSIIDLPRDYICWDDIRELNQHPIGSAKIASFIGRRIPDGKMAGEHCYGDLTEDAYGDPYKFVLAAQLGPVLEAAAKRHDSPRMRAAAAFVLASEPGRMFILDWH